MKGTIARFAILHPVWWTLAWWVAFGWIGLIAPAAGWLEIILGTVVAIILRGKLKPGFPEIVALHERRKAERAADAEWERQKRKVLPRGAHQDKEGRWHRRDGKFIPTPVLPPRPTPNYPTPPVSQPTVAKPIANAPSPDAPPPTMGTASTPVPELTGDRHIVVGTDYYQGIAALTIGALPAEVRREPNNSYDSNAIAVWAGSPLKKTGHLSAYWAERYAPLMDTAGIAKVSVPGELEPDGNLFVYMPDLTDDAEPEVEPAQQVAWTPVDSWGRCSHPTRIEGPDLELAALRRVTKSYAKPAQDDSAFDVPGIMIRSGQRASLLIDGYEIGHLSNDAAALYMASLTKLAQNQQGLAVSCNLWVASFDPKYSNVTVYLPDPSEIETPATIPAVPHVVLPAKTKIQVTGEEAHLNELVQVLGRESRVPVAATLHEMTPSSGRGKPYIEVRIADNVVGKLTPTMSEHMLPIVRACTEEHLLVVCRAAVEGNHLKADVVLDTTKSGDLSHEWIARNVQAPDEPEPQVQGEEI